MTNKQKAAIKKFEAITGFDFMHKTELRKKEMDFAEAWKSNLQWIESVLSDVINIST